MSHVAAPPDARFSASEEKTSEEAAAMEDIVEEIYVSRRVPQEELSAEQRKIEAKVIRKVDWRLIPILGLLYSVAGLDRVNLSNARVAGMNQDLRFDIGNRYSIALLVFFVTYFLFELPTILLLRPIGPKNLLNGLAVSWGAVMVGMGFVDDWRLIVVCRMLIGIFEAGFLPCCMFSLSTWYQRFEIQQRMALWYLTNLFVSAFENILAYAIIKLDDAHGIAGVEGAATIGIAILGYFLVIGFPDQMLASGKRQGFTTRELEIVLDRIDRDRRDSTPDKLTWEKFRHHVGNWELWVYGFMFLCCSAPIYSFAYFIQIILATIVDTTAMVFLLCAPPYLFSIVWTVLCAWLADRLRIRMPWMVLNAGITLAGLLITAYSSNPGARYFGIFLGVSGCNAILPTIIAFQSNNLLFAAIGGIYVSTTFMQKEYPSYRTGVWCAVATQFLLILLCAGMFLHFRGRNSATDEGRRVIQEDEFRYTF
ncbi:major facilitator superfamily domain-containing protein [Clohesyomyces aquaticus]|uniref:Major facilitator superfamily domain-containing protein n=1 Tax=Clohesyomyces aquaticus TaxID=1231657 RepID=A0A1Y2A9N1_9PLEO|nr:major facilitator superfamily domain-containing protein [Clohesyomyces aquaticus]